MTIHTTPQLIGPIGISRATFCIPVEPSACPAGFREALNAQFAEHWAVGTFVTDDLLSVDMELLTEDTPLAEMREVLDQAWQGAAERCRECDYCKGLATHYVVLPEHQRTGLRFLCDTCAAVCRDTADAVSPMPIEERAL